MNCRDIISEAKSLYSVETFVPAETLAGIVNRAREKVNKLAKLTYAEYTITTAEDAYRYLLDKSFYEIYRVTWNSNGHRYELKKILEGDFPLRSLKGYPNFYSFIPMNQLTIYPAPDDAYELNLYGYTTLQFNYTVNNMDARDEVIPEHYLLPIAYEVARRIALFDQQYELAQFFAEEFMIQMREAKI